MGASRGPCACRCHENRRDQGLAHGGYHGGVGTRHRRGPRKLLCSLPQSRDDRSYLRARCLRDKLGLASQVDDDAPPGSRYCETSRKNGVYADTCGGCHDGKQQRRDNCQHCEQSRHGCKAASDACLKLGRLLKICIDVENMGNERIRCFNSLDQWLFHVRPQFATMGYIMIEPNALGALVAAVCLVASEAAKGVSGEAGKHLWRRIAAKLGWSETVPADVGPRLRDTLESNPALAIEVLNLLQRSDGPASALVGEISAKNVFVATTMNLQIDKLE